LIDRHVQSTCARRLDQARAARENNSACDSTRLPLMMRPGSAISEVHLGESRCKACALVRATLTASSRDETPSLR
jgi:hypothetical protein